MTRKNTNILIYLLIVFSFSGLNLSASKADNHLDLKENDSLVSLKTEELVVDGQFSMARKKTKPEIKGELKKWHTIIIEFDGPLTGETAFPNPFMDYRLNVQFKGPGGKVYTRPGYYAADGNAADTRASEGNKWQVAFTPDEEGRWTFVASFRTGTKVAISLDKNPGSPTSFDGVKGSFRVGPTDKKGRDLRSKGLLRYVGERYMRFDNGEYYLKGGAGSPEGLMGYKEFDNTSDSANIYTAHAGDYDAVDAGAYTWDNGRGKNILGMAKYLSDKGMNSVYIMSNAYLGDTHHAWPWISTNASDRYRMDVSKLAQWHRLFSYMDKKGIMRHLFFGETENESLYEADEPGTPLGGFADSRKLVYREFVARFGAGLAIVWNLGEETGQDYGGPYPQNEGLTPQQLKWFSDYIAAIDDYKHVINVHEGDTAMKHSMLGYPSFTGASLYIAPNSAYKQTIKWTKDSDESGVPWVVTNDEQTPWDTFNPPDWGDPNNPNYWHDDIRKKYLWGVLMAGGSGSDWYAGFKVECSDLDCEDWRSRDHLWDMTRYANDFFHSYLPFWEMSPDNELTTNGSDWVLSKPGQVYAIYMKSFGSNSINLNDVSGNFDVRWYDPRFGGPLQMGSVSSVTGGGTRSLGNPPGSIEDDCAILIVNEAKTTTQLPTATTTPSLSVYYDREEPAISFAAEDLNRILESRDVEVTMKSIMDLADPPVGVYFVIGKNSSFLRTRLAEAGGTATGNQNEQDYALRITGSENNKGYWVLGGGRTGAMYGGIHLGELIRANSLETAGDENNSPYISKRGLKVNIPLDARQPSFSDGSTSSQENIVNVWSWEFWREYLDVMARNRYNIISLWNKHPFPSLVKLVDYPDVALDDVYNRGGNVKNMSHSEKIALWKKVIDYAWDRGIEVYWITWNIELHGAEGKHGISTDPFNQTTRDYLRKSVKELFLTYPKLAGIGVTAGEKMDYTNGNEMTASDKEDWLWDTYGKGVMEAKQEQPERTIRFIHRFWETNFEEIHNRFKQLPDGYDMSFKYSKARAFSITNPAFAEEGVLSEIPPDVTMATWWNVRNDDIFFLRWGDAEYIREYILNFPEGNKTAGYYYGSDGYFWGRETASKNPQTPRQMELEKHWYHFLLWGRMGYDINTPTELLKGLIKDRFPLVNSDLIYSSLTSVSKVVPYVLQVHWHPWDYQWWTESCYSSGIGDAIDGLHPVDEFITRQAMPGSGVTSISDFVDGDNSGVSPLKISADLEQYCKSALEDISGITDNGNIELAETIGDIKATAYLGLYYAFKVRGAVALAQFRKTGDTQKKEASVANLEKALSEWQNYATQLSEQYNKTRISAHGLFDWDARTKEVENDISIARNEK